MAQVTLIRNVGGYVKGKKYSFSKRYTQKNQQADL